MTACAMQSRENKLRAIRFERPDIIPMQFSINAACWHHYEQEALFDLMEEHALLFPGYKRPESGVVVPSYSLNSRAAEPYSDPWGCTWHTSDDGISGTVHVNPLASWERFDEYRAPNAALTDGTFPVDWSRIAENVARGKEKGSFIQGGLPHGHTFLRLQDIRGYTNLIMDMADEDARLTRLIDMVSVFNTEYIRRWIDLSPDMLSFPEDLGMQVGPMLSPDMFRKFIKPAYQRMMNMAREKGIIVHMHSDGDIRTLADDLIDGGVEVINLQDLVNGIDWIADRFAGRVCIDLDIDRQKITPYGSPADIDALIREEVTRLNTKQGGLMMIYGLYPGVPLENVKAVMDAMECYAII